jgi:hypothetical protein
VGKGEQEVPVTPDDARDKSPEEERDPFDALSDKDQRFVEGICAGMTGIEAAKYAGSEATTRPGLASIASRWRSRPEIKAAIGALRKQHALDDDDLWDMCRRTLREILQDKGNPGARARACELMARLLGKLQPERHEHVHTHMDLPDLSSPEGQAELVRVLRIALDAMPGEQRESIVRQLCGEPA